MFSLLFWKIEDTKISFREFLTFIELQNGMNTTTGRFTVPNAGYYSISFSGALNSLDGSRIWIKLNMKDAKTGEVIVYFLNFPACFEIPICIFFQFEL